jgi:hypothetical protein
MNHTAHFRLARHVGQIALAASLLCLGAAAMAVPDAQFQPAFNQFMQASAGDAAAVEGAADAFSSLLKSEPTNPVLMAYTGASTAMKATTTMLPWKKMTYAEDGLALLDKSLAMLNASHDAPMQRGTPGVLEVKFVAANTFLAVPGFMNRHERGTKLLGDVVNSPLFATAPLPFKGTVWLKAAGEATKANNTAEAKRYLGLIVNQQAPQAAKAQALLKGMAS